MKANFLSLLLLEDEIESFDRTLSKPIESMRDWIEKLRTTRALFLSLYNLKDLTTKLRIRDVLDHTKRTKSLRKNLELANHFRNKGIGHLDTELLKRAVQWNPLMFVKEEKDTTELRLADVHKAVIESCINSYIDKNGVQKQFGHEIDLFYPENAEEFYDYLKSLVIESLEWISLSKEVLSSKIKYHSTEELFELACVAGATSFDLKGNTDLSFCEVTSKNNILEALKKLSSYGLPQEVIHGKIIIN